MQKRVLSGIQPSGRLHLGNLIGALENWVKLQPQYECFFCIADLHALTTGYANTRGLKDLIRDVAVDLLAVGIDPQKAALFVQSDIPEHAELHLMLSMITPLSWLQRVPTYKSQIEELTDRDLGTYGFLGYPLLQAADILIYKADFVPVGQDQLPHIELSREIARRFNHLYGQTFPEPRELLGATPLLPGTDARKMSKSYQNTIALSDSEEVIRKKISQMFTDPKRLRKNDPGHPDECPVYTYRKIFARADLKEIKEKCLHARMGCVECKKNLAEALIAYLGPVLKRRREILKDKKLLDEVLKQGKDKACQVVSQTMQEAKKAMNLI